MNQYLLTYETESTEIDMLIAQGIELLCPRCKTKLTLGFVTSPKTGQKLLQSIDCPKNSNHYGILRNYDLGAREMFIHMQDEWEKNNNSNNQK